MNTCARFKATCSRIARLRSLRSQIHNTESAALTHYLANNGTGSRVYEDHHDELAAEYNELRYWFQPRTIPFREDDGPEEVC